MTLSKLEIQQMLREMNVKFHADDTHEDLKLRLQQANHSLWLKSVSGEQTPDGQPEKRVVRKRKKEIPPQDSNTDPPADPTDPGPISQPAPRPATGQRRTDPPLRRQTIEKPTPGKPWKAAADGTEPFNRKKNVFQTVLRRARNCCEHCGLNSEKASKSVDLEPFHILPLDQGGEHSIKNVVALCPACMQVLQSDPDPKVVKELKRKTRTKLYDSLQVERKKKGHRRKGHSGRRK